MSIPKKIHYCWFGNGPLPPIAKKCIASWKKHCPQYEIIEWNERNFAIENAPLYVRQAYQEKKWAFVTDYVRLHVVYAEGGIYLDTDVELKKNLDSLLSYSAYFGFEDGQHIATGLGFGAEKGAPILLEIMDDYKNIPFILENNSYDLTPCPFRNTLVLLKHGLVQDDSKQILPGNILILPSIYLCPIKYQTKEHLISKETISIHWFTASWKDKKAERRMRRAQRRYALKHNLFTFIKRILGEDLVKKVKSLFKRT